MKGPSHSGAHLLFTDTSVIKFGEGSVGQRLWEQQAKMASWDSQIAGVRVPRTAARFYMDEVHLDIERVAGPGLSLACDKWVTHMELLLDLVDALFLRAEPADVTHLFQQKIVDLRSKPQLQTKKGRQALDQVAELATDLVAPVGPCHGDLTLCNVLCDCAHGLKGDIALVDLIEPFVSSPLQDLAKIAQDTHHGWVSLHVPEVEQYRLDECRRMVNRRFSDVLRSRAFRAFDAMTLLRIFPYAQTDVVRSWVKKELTACLKAPSS